MVVKNNFDWRDLNNREFICSIGEDYSSDGCYVSAILYDKENNESYVVHTGFIPKEFEDET